MGKRASKSVTLSRGTWSLSPEGEVYCCATEVRPAPVIGRITAVQTDTNTRYEALTGLGVPITDGEGCEGGTYADKSAASNAVFYREHPGWNDLPCTWSVQHDRPCGSQMDTYYLITRLPREDAEHLAKTLRYAYRDDTVRAKPNTADRECRHDVATPQGVNPMNDQLSHDKAAIRVLAAGLDMQITDLALPGVDPETDGFSLAYLGDGEPLPSGCDELTLADIVIAVAVYVAHIEAPRLRESDNDMVITHYRDNRPSLLVWESEALSDGGTEGSHKYRCGLRREVSDEPMVSFVVDLTNVWSKVSLNRS